MTDEEMYEIMEDYDKKDARDESKKGKEKW
jgi:hypothetical protein